MNHLKDYADKIANSGFCNDITYYKAKDITPVYANNTDHSIYKKSNWKNTITLKCDSSDNYNILTESNGNRLLNYPIGILSAQEVALAGGYLTHSGDNYNGGVDGKENKTFYLYTGTSFWTMSPYSYSASSSEGSRSKVVYFGANGYMQPSTLTSSYDVIPVISLRSTNIVSTGSGTSVKPYIIY